MKLRIPQLRAILCVSASELRKRKAGGEWVRHFVEHLGKSAHLRPLMQRLLHRNPRAPSIGRLLWFLPARMGSPRLLNSGKLLILVSFYKASAMCGRLENQRNMCSFVLFGLWDFQVEEKHLSCRAQIELQSETLRYNFGKRLQHFSFISSNERIHKATSSNVDWKL